MRETTKYRIVQLGDLNIFRVERWTKRWFSPEYHWKIVRVMDGYGESFVSEVDSHLGALNLVEQLQLRDKIRHERKRGNWRTRGAY